MGHLSIISAPFAALSLRRLFRRIKAGKVSRRCVICNGSGRRICLFLPTPLLFGLSSRYYLISYYSFGPRKENNTQGFQFNTNGVDVNSGCGWTTLLSLFEPPPSHVCFSERLIVLKVVVYLFQFLRLLQTLVGGGGANNKGFSSPSISSTSVVVVARRFAVLTVGL